MSFCFCFLCCYFFPLEPTMTLQRKQHKVRLLLRFMVLTCKQYLCDSRIPKPCQHCLHISISEWGVVNIAVWTAYVKSRIIFWHHIEAVLSVNKPHGGSSKIWWQLNQKRAFIQHFSHSEVGLKSSHHLQTHTVPKSCAQTVAACDSQHIETRLICKATSFICTTDVSWWQQYDMPVGSRSNPDDVVGTMNLHACWHINSMTQMLWLCWQQVRMLNVPKAHLACVALACQ